MTWFAAVPAKLWLLLAAGPFLFFAAFVGLSVWFSARGVAPAQIPDRITARLPHILTAVLGSVGLLLATQSAVVAHAWRLPTDIRRLVTGTLAGLVVGAVLAMVYLQWLEPGLVRLQRRVGDYVPPGSVLPAVSGNLVWFFVANVLLAPLVEETLYRGVALPLMAAQTGTATAVVVSCLLFGLLHWAGGLWYMLLTGLVGGGIFTALYLWSGHLLAPVAAHLALNLVEWGHAAWRAPRR